MGSAHIRILLADQEALFRGAVRIALQDQSDLELIAETAEAPQTVVEVARRRPDVVVLNMDLPGGGVRVTRWVRKRVPQCRILILAEQAEEEEIIKALEAGASGYLPRQCSAQELMDGIRAANHGEFVMPSRMLSMLLGRLIAKEMERDDTVRLDEDRVIQLDELARTRQRGDRPS